MLNDIHIDIMDYIAPATCADVQFRSMWAEFEWENKARAAAMFQGYAVLCGVGSSVHLISQHACGCLVPTPVHRALLSRPPHTLCSLFLRCPRETVLQSLHRQTQALQLSQRCMSAARWR